MKTLETRTPVPINQSLWRWWICLLLMNATVINYMDRMALNQMAKLIKDYFVLNDFQYSRLESAFSFAFGLGAISVGFIVDRISVRWVYPVMVLGWSCVGICTGFVGSFETLLLCRFLLGVFEAGNWPCGIRTTRAVLPPRERSFGNSLFQSGTALGAVITPIMVQLILSRYESSGSTEVWRIPFQAIGTIGILWIGFWFFSVSGSMVNTLEPPSEKRPAEGATRFRDVFTDPRYWAVVGLVIAVNIIWHGYRTWMPLYLQEQRGYSLKSMNYFSSFYYLVADCGAWTVGLVTLLLCRMGMGVHRSRVLMCGCCSVLGLTTLAIPFLPNGWPLEAGLLVVGFSAMGLFPTYFALSQEISSRHQGKVTGMLGISAHFTLALVYQLEGRICDLTHTKEWVLGGVGVVPILTFGLLLVLWPTEKTKPITTVDSINSDSTGPIVPE